MTQLYSRLKLEEILDLIPGDKFLVEFDENDHIQQAIKYNIYEYTEIEKQLPDTRLGIADNRNNILFVFDNDIDKGCSLILRERE